MSLPPVIFLLVQTSPIKREQQSNLVSFGIGVLNRLVLNRLGSSSMRLWCYSVKNPCKISSKQKRDRDSNSQPRPRPRFNSHRAGFKGVTERGVFAFACQYIVSPCGRTGNRTVTQMRHPLLVEGRPNCARQSLALSGTKTLRFIKR